VYVKYVRNGLVHVNDGSLLHVGAGGGLVYVVLKIILMIISLQDPVKHLDVVRPIAMD